MKAAGSNLSNAGGWHTDTDSIDDQRPIEDLENDSLAPARGTNSFGELSEFSIKSRSGAVSRTYEEA
jgi:hypothetical protein